MQLFKRWLIMICLRDIMHRLSLVINANKKAYLSSELLNE